jgi:hypothetical protein
MNCLVDCAPIGRIMQGTVGKCEVVHSRENISQVRPFSTLIGGPSKSRLSIVCDLVVGIWQ